MREVLIENPVLALFLVIGLGYGLGRVQIRNFRLGIAAVLFFGLGIGAFAPGIQVPDFMVYFGLALFVYCIGLASGPSFFSTLKTHGIRDVGFVVTMLTLTASIALGLAFLLDLDASVIAGLYAGSTTNTPALAGLIDLISQKEGMAEIANTLIQESVSGYSLAYPFGIFGTIIALILMQRLFRVNYAAESESLKDKYPVSQNIINTSILITNPEVAGMAIRDLKHKYKLKVIFGRRVRGEETILTNWDTDFQHGDKTILIGDEADVNRAVSILGKALQEDLTADETEYVAKRIFVSNPDVAGQKLSALNLNERFSAIVTRIRRGDIDILASQDAILELGDMVRFVTRERDAGPLATYFGDSYESLSKINLFAFGFGISLGLLLGMVAFHLPGGLTFKLGFAVGPIVVAILLGALRRTGPVVWTLPYSANLTLQQLGLAILLGGIGLNSGDTFLHTLGDVTGLAILGASLVISFVSACLTLILGYKVVRMPFSILLGMVSHQPAILDYTVTQTKNSLPNLGFTLMLPIATILKIFFVQVLYLFLQ